MIQRRSNFGYTLIELVLAMGIVVILSMSLYAGLRSAFRAQDSAERAIEPSRTAEAALEFIRQDLQNAVPPTGIIAGAFVGTDNQLGREADQIKFFATSYAPQHESGNGDVKLIEILLATPQGDTQNAILRHVSSNVLSQITPVPDEEVLCRGVSALNFRYHDGVDWVNSWDSTQTSNTLPVAVEVTLELDRPTSSGEMHTYFFRRVFTIPCYAPAPDSTTTGGTAQ